MSVFSPEFHEDLEPMFEGKLGKANMEAQIRKALQNKQEMFADIILCPVQSCGTPVTVELREEDAKLSCSNCGWHTVILLNNQTT